MAEFFCSSCKCIFSSVKKDKNRTPKYCSRKCYANREITEEWIKKISDARLGKVPWNKGINMWKGKPHPKGTLGKTWERKAITEETRIKLRNAHLGKRKKNPKNFTCVQCQVIFERKKTYKNRIPKFCSRNKD